MFQKISLLNKFCDCYKINVKFKHDFRRIKDILNQGTGIPKVQEVVNVKGWVKNIRKMKDLVFADLNDGSCSKNLQVVLEKSKFPNIAYGISIDVLGRLDQTPKGQIEVHGHSCKIMGECPLEGFPFLPKKSYAMDYIRSNIHMRSRVQMMNSTFRTRHHASKLFREYLNTENYIEIHTPILTSNDCEGAGETFLVKPGNPELLKNMAKPNVELENAYFDHPTFLTVSGQLHLEAMSHGLGNVYTFGPTFRAENCKSPIHLSEFYMLEIEKVFVESIENLIEETEAIIKTVTKKLLDQCAEDILTVRNQKNLDDFNWLDKKFQIINYKEAIRILTENQTALNSKVEYNEGISKEQELFLVKHLNGPVFVVDWPEEIKSFYMREKKKEPGFVEALDLLVPHVGELIGGSVREDDYDKLRNKLPNLEALQWYLDLRKYGSVTTAGFGMGFERYLQWILNVHNIKDVIPFPRWAHNCTL